MVRKNKLLVKATAMFLMSMLIFVGTPMHVYATPPTSGYYGENIVWTFNDKTGLLRVMGWGEMHDNPYDYSMFPQEHRFNTKRIEVDYGITSICDYAFADFCAEELYISDTVESIGEGAFERCFDLKSVNIPDSVEYIGPYAFLDCKGVTDLTLSSGLTSIDMMTFGRCKSLTSVSIPEGITTIGSQAFSGCSELTSVTMPDGLKTIKNNAFEDCSSLVNIKIPDSVTSIGTSAFRSCVGIQSITIPSGVEDIAYVFGGCTGLKSVSVPGSIKNMDRAFAGCTSLEDVQLHEGITTIGGSAFVNCSSLTSVHLPESITTISGNAFENCAELISINAKKAVVRPESFYGCKKLQTIECIAKDGFNIPERVFAYCTGLEEAKIYAVKDWEAPKAVEKEAFVGCDNLTKVTIPDSVNSIKDSAFKYCNRLNTVVIHGNKKQLSDFEVEGNNVAFILATFVNEPHNETTEIVNSPTKTETGLKVYKCSICGYIFRTETIPALGYDPTPNPQNPSSDDPFSENFIPAMIEEQIVYPDSMIDPSTLNCKFYHRGGKSYWYENGVRQGTFDDPKGVVGDGTVRGREICDMETVAWYWCDSIYDGAKAINKEVWMPYVYQDEKNWSEEQIKQVASESGSMASQVEAAIKSGTGKWVRYNANGKMFKGWYKVTGSESQIYPDKVGNIYYYDERTGLMAHGNTVIDGVTYHFDEVSGVLQR